MTFNGFLVLIYLTSCGLAIYQGHRKFWILVALVLALTFQYVLGFSALAKLVVAGIFLFYFVFPLLPQFVGIWDRTPSLDPDPIQANSFRRSKKNKAAADKVFQEFMQFSESQKDPTSQPKQKHRGEEGKKRNTSKSSQRRGSKKRYYRQEPRSEKKSETGKKRGHSRRNSNSTNNERTSQAEINEARLRLQEEQHELQREKTRLEETATRVEKANADASRLLKEQKIAAATKSKAVTDTRTPEEILCVTGGYTLKELKEARNREVVRWNPSNMVNKPQELKDQAEEELKKINAAFDVLKKKL